jgi:hypothetical protein
MEFPKLVPLRSPRESLGGYILLPRLIDKAPRSSLLRRSSHFGYEGRKLRGISRNSPTRRPEPLGGAPKPLPSFVIATEGSLTFIPIAAYSTEAVASAAKAGSCGVFGEGE